MQKSATKKDELERSIAHYPAPPGLIAVGEASLCPVVLIQVRSDWSYGYEVLEYSYIGADFSEARVILFPDGRVMEALQISGEMSPEDVTPGEYAEWVVTWHSSLEAYWHAAKRNRL